MNKTERRKFINSSVYTFLNKNYSNFDIDYEGDGGRVYFRQKTGKAKDSIEYHLSRHTIETYVDCDPIIKIVARDIERFINEKLIY